MNILGFFFDIYKSPKAVRFGSRLYAFYGRFLVRTPMSIFPNVHPLLKAQYYDIKEDRGSGHEVEQVGLKKWEADQLALEQLRMAELPHVAKAAAINAFLLCVVLLAMAWVVSPSPIGLAKQRAAQNIAAFEKDLAGKYDEALTKLDKSDLSEEAKEAQREKWKEQQKEERARYADNENKKRDAYIEQLKNGEGK